MTLGHERAVAGRSADISVCSASAVCAREHGPAAAKRQVGGMVAGAAAEAVAVGRQRHAAMAGGWCDDGDGRMAHHSLIAARFRHPFAAWLDHTTANGYDHA